jgi:hypothetical protein
MRSDDPGREGTRGEDRAQLQRDAGGGSRPGADRYLRHLIGGGAVAERRHPVGERRGCDRRRRGAHGGAGAVHELPDGTLGEPHRPRDRGPALAAQRAGHEHVTLPVG